MKRILILISILILSLTACSSNSTSSATPVVLEVGGQSASDVTQTEEIMTPVAEVDPATYFERETGAQELRVNQVGYLPNAQKIAFAAIESSQPLDWSLLNDTGEVVASGQATIKGFDPVSGDYIQTLDFSNYTTPGEDYRVEVNGLESYPFDLNDDLYTQLKIDAAGYFYRSRSGTPIEAQYAGADWARAAGHLSDNNVTCWKGTDADGVAWPGCDYTLDASGGWYDAGDYGKYVVNGGIAVWTLMNLYEQMPEAFTDGSLSILENSNGISDILDEARWEMEFLLKMQVPAGQELAGMVHHKLHSESWGSLPMLPPTEMENDNANAVAGSGRYLFPPSTAATLNLAASGALCARLWQTLDADFSQRCLSAAETAWQAALAHPAIYAGNNPGDGGGNYDDTDVSDEFYWAASELYITTGKEEYHSYLLGSERLGDVESFDWQSTATLGTLSLASTANTLSTETGRLVRNSILIYANELIEAQSQDGYSVPINSAYPWGSNGLILNNMMVIAEAYSISGEPQYLDAVREGMSYLLGRNPVNLSYISGYGSVSMQHPHHSFWANDPANGYPAPPPGVLAGGPNANPTDETAVALNLAALPESRRYADVIGTYTTNEVAINWNAPLVWVSAFLDENR